MYLQKCNYLVSVIDDSVITCNEIIDRTRAVPTTVVQTIFN